MKAPRASSEAEKLVLTHLTAARAFAKQLVSLRRRLGDAEVVAACEDGLMEAAKAFDPARLVPFWSFARLVIRRRLARAARSAHRFHHLAAALLALPPDAPDGSATAGPTEVMDATGIEDRALPAAIREQAQNALAEAFVLLGVLHPEVQGDGEAAMVEVLFVRQTTAATDAALSRLSASEAAAIRERLVEAATWDELAQRHGISPSTLKRRWVDVREQVRQELLGQGGMPSPENSSGC